MSSSRSSRLLVPFLVSVLLHGALAGWLLTRPAPRHQAKAETPISVEMKWLPTKPLPPPSVPASRQEVPRPQLASKRRGSAGATTPPPSPPAVATEARAPSLSGAPLAEPLTSAPQLSLTPSLDAIPWVVGPAEAPRGRTLRPGDPSLRPEVIAAEEKARVGGRVQGWLDDTLADARAQTGLPHPYFVGLREALEGELGHSDGGTPRQLGITSPLQALAKSYTEASEQYARTGNPGLPPPGSAPTLSEKLGNMPGADVPMLLRAQVQATEIQKGLEHKGPMLALKLELLQGREGQLLKAEVVESSGNGLFDAFVLRVGPDALGRLAAPPQDAFRGDTLRSVWEVNGWLRTPKTSVESLAQTLLPNLMGVPTGALVDQLAAKRMRFEYRARLLRVY